MVSFYKWRWGGSLKNASCPHGKHRLSVHLNYRLHPSNCHWRGGMRRPTKDGPEIRQTGTPTGPEWPHLWWIAFLGPPDGSCRVLCHLELIWYGFWTFFSAWLGPDLPGKWTFSPWAHVGWCYALFFVYFWHVSCVIPTCPSAIDESSKLVELCQLWALFLSLVFTWMDFI